MNQSLKKKKLGQYGYFIQTTVLSEQIKPVILCTS